jgi:transposase-like protein
LENIGYLGFYFYEIVVPQAKETALSMAADGMKAEKIAHYLKVSVAMVQNWIDESMSVVQ